MYLDTWTRDAKAGKLSLLDKVKIKAMKVDPSLISGLDPVKLALGTDISHWQGTVDFKTLRTDGKVSIVFPKASDGKQVRDGSPSEWTNYVDDYLYRNVQGCYDNRVICAPYHYVQPHFAGYTVKGIADQNWKAIKTAMDPLVPGVSYHAFCLDVEEIGGSEPNRSTVVMDLISRIRNDAKLSKALLLLYSSNNILVNYYPGLMNQVSYQGSKVVDGLWMAQWTYNKVTNTTWAEFWSTYLPKVEMKVITPGYAGWSFVQWSSSFVLPGCAGRMDVNAYKASEAHLDAWLGYERGTTPPPPEPEPEPDLAELVARVAALEEQAHPRVHTHITGGPVA